MKIKALLLLLLFIVIWFLSQTGIFAGTTAQSTWQFIDINAVGNNAVNYCS